MYLLYTIKINDWFFKTISKRVKMVFSDVVLMTAWRIFDFMSSFYEVFYVLPEVIEKQRLLEEEMIHHNKEILAEKLQGAMDALEIQNDRIKQATIEDDMRVEAINKKLEDLEQRIGKADDRRKNWLEQQMLAVQTEGVIIQRGIKQRYTILHTNQELVRTLSIKKNTIDSGAIDLRLLGGTAVIDQFIETVRTAINARNNYDNATVLADLKLSNMPITPGSVAAYDIA